MVPSSPKILVGLSVDVQVSAELLSWAIGVAAQPDDSVVALHILVGKDEKKIDSIEMTMMRRAKAFVISILGEFADLCRAKQVNLEARVGWYSSVGKGLVDEAASLEAAFLIIGSSRKRAQRNSLEITNYCFKHAPEDCSVVAIRKRGLPPQDFDSESVSYEGFRRSMSKGSNKGLHTRKPLSPLQRLLTSKKKRQNSFSKSLKHSPTESSEKHSPRAVFDGPESGIHIVEDGFSLDDSVTTKSPPIEPKLGDINHQVNTPTHSSKWKSLSMVKVLFPFFRPAVDEVENERESCLSDEEIQRPSWRCFSYEEISRATNNFHPDNMVGRGGYSEVYRGDLCNGQTIAVKRLAKDNPDEQKEKEFLMELGVIGHVCHPNTLYLMGCCIENGLHLIFNFSPNGTLSSALHGSNSKPLEWSVRYKIVVGIARGLHYLHKRCKRRIIHRDIKASNVLLGPDSEPQISDFGLAKWLPTQWTHHSVIPIEGTFGYLAPEYFMHGIVDEKTDVFSFGVLLLEIITGRRPVDSTKPTLLSWAKPLLESGNVAALVDPKLDGKYDIDQMHRLVLTASYCVRRSSIWRPSMSEVLQLVTDGHDPEIMMSQRNSGDSDDNFRDNDCHYSITCNLEEDD